MTEPETITEADFEAALRVLRIDMTDLARIDCTPGKITVYRHRRNTDGKIWAAGKEPAQVVTTIAMTGKSNPEREQVDVSTYADLARGERKFVPGALKI